MKFKISRTSDITRDRQPCKEAIKEKYTRIDERTVGDPSKLQSYDSESWYSDGTNHRIENGHIKRDIENEGWFVEIQTLEELVKFYEKYGDIIIRQCWRNPSIVEIEIYDDYRE